MDEKTMTTKLRIAAIIVIWFFVLGTCVLIWKYWVNPSQQKAAEKQMLQQHQKISAEFPRQDTATSSLSEEEWKGLRIITTLQVPRLIFARGKIELSDGSMATLDKLLEILHRWPRYYLVIQGSQSSVGDEEANKLAAESRAQLAADYLINKGIDEVRIRIETLKQNGSTVSFILGETQ